MAYTDTLSGKLVQVAIGDGATPTEAFTVLCGILEKTLDRTKNITETTVYDCADVNAPPVVQREVENTDWSMNASGQLDRGALTGFEAAYNASGSRNVRFIYKDTVINKYYQGKAIMSNLQIGATNGQKTTVSVNLVADGPLSALVANP